MLEQRHIQNLVKPLRWSFAKIVNGLGSRIFDWLLNMPLGTILENIKINKNNGLERVNEK